MRRRTIWTSLSTAALLGTITLAGCTSAPEAEADEPGGDSASFLACLTAAGVDAKINDAGQVLVKTAVPSGGDGSISVDSGDDGVLGMESDDAGDTWVIASGSDYFEDDPATQDAYASCEAAQPDFTQPEGDPFAGDAEFEAEQQAQEEAALAFAQCARESGYAQVEDPDFSQANALMVPDEMTEDELRSLLEECWDHEGPVFNFGQSIDAPFEAWAVLDEFLGTPA